MVDEHQQISLQVRLSRNIAARRKTLGLTQSMLAERMEMEPESISRFERGVTLPSLATLETLARVLNTTIADLLDEYPGSAYPEERMLAALMTNLSPQARKDLAHVVEYLCRMLDHKTMVPEEN